MLEVSGLRVSYGGINAVKGIDLAVRAGEMVTLIGANGAGKTTTLKALTGLIRPAAGSVRYNGAEMTGVALHRRIGMGIALVPEGRGLFPGMSVLENLRMGGYARGLGGRRLAERIDTVCAGFPALLERFEQRAGSLSGGQQQILALARALVGAPEILLLDEPSTGLAPLLVAEVFDRIKELKRSGMTIILAEQNVGQALQVADRAYVMKTGRVVMEGPSSQVAEADEVRQAYLGM